MTRRSRIQRERDELAQAFWTMRRMRREMRETAERLTAARESCEAEMIELDRLWLPEVGEALARIVRKAGQS